MAKIQRKTQKVFAGSALNNGQFGSAQLGTKVESSDLDTLQALAAFNNGWVDAVLSGDNLPPLEEFQALSYIETSQIAYILQEGIPEYDTGTEYHANSIVKKTGTFEIYGSLINTNTGNALPSQVSDANWKYLGKLGDKSVNSYTDTGVADAYQLDIAGGFDSPDAYTDGMIVNFKATNDNTGATTLQIGALGAKSVTLPDGTALSGGEILLNAYIKVVFNTGADRFELVVAGGSGGATTLLHASSVSSPVSTIDVTSVFSADFDVYKIYMSNATADTDRTVRWQWRSSSAPITSANYYEMKSLRRNITSTIFNTNNIAQTSFESLSIQAPNAGTRFYDMEITVYNPFNTEWTYAESRVLSTNSSDTHQYEWTGHFLRNTTSVEGIRFLLNAGDYESAEIQVYGMNKS